MADHNELGKIGEQLAVNFLESKGYDILARNFLFQKAEVDVIARYNNTIVCVEVKTRNSDYFGDPQDFVSPAKIKNLVKAMDAYVIDNDIADETRFDIIAILKNKNIEQITHYENAFYHF